MYTPNREEDSSTKKNKNKNKNREEEEEKSGGWGSWGFEVRLITMHL